MPRRVLNGNDFFSGVVLRILDHELTAALLFFEQVQKEIQGFSRGVAPGLDAEPLG